MTGNIIQKARTTGSVTEVITMAALVDRIQANTSLTAARRRNVASSIRRFCELVGADPNRTPATFWALREHLHGFCPIASGVTKKRFSTIKSDVSFALRQISAPTAKPRVPLSNAWAEARSRAQNMSCRLSLSRLMTYCSLRNISPEDVDDSVIATYRGFVEQQTFKTSPQSHVREACLHWNKLCAAAGDDLGLKVVSMPAGRATYAANWDELPGSLRSEAEDWLVSMSTEADLFDARAPTRPLRPTSIKVYRFKIRQYLGALREQGQDIAKIRRLKDLVELERVRLIVTFFQDRSTTPGKIADSNILHVLRLIARWTRPDDEALHRALKRGHGRVSPGPKTMGKRARQALRQFDDQNNVDQLLNLPLRTAARLDRKHTLTRREALDYQAAVALELQIMRPLRKKNLVALKLGEHVLCCGTRTRISIPAEEVKNTVWLEYVLPDESAALLDRYIRKVLPVLSESATGYLFPSSIEGRPKAGSNLGKQLTKFIRDETGLYVTINLMRQIATKIYMRAHPEGLETMRHVLAHTSVETTARSYAELENTAALERYDALILDRRSPITSKAPK